MSQPPAQDPQDQGNAQLGQQGQPPPSQPYPGYGSQPQGYPPQGQPNYPHLATRLSRAIRMLSNRATHHKVTPSNQGTHPNRGIVFEIARSANGSSS